MPRRRVTLKQQFFRLLGIVSPSGSYPLPPRWALSRKVRRTWYPGPVTASGDRSVAVDRNDWVADVAPGPLTDFRYDPPRHVCAPVCQPGDGGPASCFRPSTSGRQEGAQGC